ncbi:helix-turn-helix domain-containing protein [Streptomyces atacamensis]|uniref:helix-turn-helix domain-containing protein n=1 Tax=Streptomyces atacamensis TaxID=531966 RepID=UPI00399D293E
MRPAHRSAFRPDVMREVRQRAGLSRAQLAVLAQVSPETVRAAENRRHTPSVRVLRAIAEALAVPVDELCPAAGPPTLKQLRRRTGLTQKQTAQAIGVSAQMVSRVEAGVYGVRDPARWAAAYQVDRKAWTAAWEAGREARRREVQEQRDKGRGKRACRSSQPEPPQSSPA